MDFSKFCDKIVSWLNAETSFKSFDAAVNAFKCLL